jgi:hypothetical protein
MPFPNAFVGHLQLPEEPKSKVKKPAKDEKLRAYHVLLLKEMLNAILYVIEASIIFRTVAFPFTYSFLLFVVLFRKCYLYPIFPPSLMFSSLPPNEFTQLELAPFWKEKSAKNVNLFSPLILHQDDELSNLVLHFYQRVVVEIPQYRILLISVCNDLDDVSFFTIFIFLAL